MRRVINPIFISGLVGVFLVGSFVCCCARHLMQPQKVVKTDCCHKTAKADPVKCTDGCSSLSKSTETAKAFDLVPSTDVQITSVIVSTFSFKPVHTIKPVFLNGPPGPFTVVPLYTQFHSLRI